MNQKLTQTEFKKWGKQLLEAYSAMTNPSTGLQFETEAYREEWVKLGVLASVYAKSGVIQAVLIGGMGLKILRVPEDIPYQEFGGKTFEEFGKEIFGKLKEHCIANGYYNPSSPSDLAQLGEKAKKVVRILLDDKELPKYLIYADSEENKVLINTAGFFKGLNEILPSKMDSLKGYITPELSFLTEDLVARMEKLISLKEQAEKPNGPSSPIPPPTSTNLETEIKDLENKVRELEGLIESSSNSTEKETYQKLLKSFQKSLDDKNKEKDKINNPSLNQPNSNNSNKLNIAIAVGVVAVLIGIICLIAIANQKKER